MPHNPYDIISGPFLFRIQPAQEGSRTQAYVFIHGWTGNERSMSVFQSIMPKNALCIFPRGAVAINDEQYGWAMPSAQGETGFSGFAETAEPLLKHLQKITAQLAIDADQKMNLIGFSQGASMCLVLSLLYPQYFEKVAVLSGYLPHHFPNKFMGSYAHLRYYIAHGTEDDQVDFQKALEIEVLLSELGADVKLCSANIGHKVSPSCFQGLRKFFQPANDL